MALKKRELADKKAYLDDQVKRIDKERQSILEAERELDRFIEKHHFDTPNIADKQVMTKEKWLYHDLFQDHDPESIERLGETEQISLF